MGVLSEIERYLRETGMPWTKFGRLAVGDPRLVSDLRNGRAPRPAMIDRIHAFIRAG